MSICNPCIKVKSIPKCTQSVVLGTITPDTDVSVYVWDVTTSLIQTLDAASDNAGLLTVDFSDLALLSSHAYEVWATTAGGNYKDKLTITVGSTEGDTICLHVEEVKGVDGEMELFSSQTLLEA